MYDAEIQLEIDGKNFEGWKKITVSRSMEAFSASFGITLIDTAGEATAAIVAGEDVTLWIVSADGTLREKIITGFIDSVQKSVTGDSTEMSVTGRDRTADLVDCSAERLSGTWTRAKFSQIIKDLCDRLDIGVNAGDLSSDNLIEKFTLQPGETAFQAIERLCRSQAVLPLTSAAGEVLLSYAGSGSADDALELGDNILTLSQDTSSADRFSHYTGKGQNSNKGKKWTERNTQLKALAIDYSVTRYRPLVFLKEGRSSDEDLRSRVNWEAQVRAGRATTYSVRVRGWLQRSGRPWEINELITLRAGRWGVDEELLISSVTMTIDDASGRVTDLVLKNPATYAADPTEEVTPRDPRFVVVYTLPGDSENKLGRSFKTAAKRTAFIDAGGISVLSTREIRGGIFI